MANDIAFERELAAMEVRLWVVGKGRASEFVHMFGCVEEFPSHNAG